MYGYSLYLSVLYGMSRMHPYMYVKVWMHEFAYMWMHVYIHICVYVNSFVYASMYVCLCELARAVIEVISFRLRFYCIYIVAYLTIPYASIEKRKKKFLLKIRMHSV